MTKFTAHRLSCVLMGLLLCSGVAASGASASGLVVIGFKEEGDGLDAFTRVIDFGTGSERFVEMQGASAAERGFDGQYWGSFNGTQTIIDLPSEVADRNAERWIGHNIWKLRAADRKRAIAVRPAGASRITIEFDLASKLPASAVIDSDFGPLRLSFSDWRAVGGRRYPHRIERLTDTGEKAVVRAQSVRFVETVDPQLLARPMLPPTSGKLSGAVVVPFRTSARGTHMLVDAVVDGKAGEFVFDTGAANIFTTEAAKKRGIKVSGGISISGVGEGSEAGGFAQVKTVSLGNAILTDQSFLIIPPIFPPVNGKPAPTQGLLGFEFFAHFITTIDYRTKTLTFQEEVPARQAGTKLPFFSDGHSLYVQARINDQPGWFRVDTGDGGGVTLFPAFSKRARLEPAGAVETSGAGGVGGAVKEARGIADRFELGGVTVSNLPVRFSLNTKGAFASRFLAGNLGGRILSCYRMTFDHDNHVVWLEPLLETPTCQVADRLRPDDDGASGASQ